MKSFFDFDQILDLEILNSSEKITSQRPIILYGAGGFGEAALKYYKTNNIKPIAICDSDPNKVGKNFFGYTIMSFNDIINCYSDFDVVITAFKYYDEIKNFLIHYISPARIINISFLHENSYTLALNYRSFLSQNLDRLNIIYSRLEDNISRHVMESILKAKVSNDVRYFEKCRTGNQYFPNDIVHLSDQEYFLDCGAFIGDTLKDFIEKVSNKYEMIYCFEPSPEAFHKLKQLKETVFKNNENILLHRKGLLDTDKKIGFNILTGAGSERIDEQFSNINNIDVVSIDNVIQGKVTFIKMDIEGSELAALKGAKKTILQNKPKLAICVYHKEEDILTIPEYIMGLGLDYKYYIRHHGISPNSHCETVFYAV